MKVYFLRKEKEPDIAVLLKIKAKISSILLKVVFKNLGFNRIIIWFRHLMLKRENLSDPIHRVTPYTLDLMLDLL
jgi:hypothetical protein